MTKFSICLALACGMSMSAVSASAQQWVPAEPQGYRAAPPQTAYAAPAQRRGGMGGGFIEYLMGGGDEPGPYAAQPVRSVPQPAYAPASRAPATAYEDEDNPRLAPRGQVPVRGGAYGAQAPAPRGIDPRFLPQTVAYSGSHKAGTVIIDTNAKYLYLVEAGGQARRYGIGVGRPGFTWKGVKTITRKAEWPDWRPPAEMLRRRPDLPRFMAGGPENPLGARAMYLGSTLYRIHGSNEPHTIGTAVSSGCFRMRNEDVVDLYRRVKVGTTVVVM